MTKDARMILSALDLLHAACENIGGLGGCDRCPLKTNCLEMTSALTLAEDVTANQFEEFLGYSDDVENYKDEQDWKESYADQARKIALEERMIDDEWGI